MRYIEKSLKKTECAYLKKTENILFFGKRTHDSPSIIAETNKGKCLEDSNPPGQLRASSILSY